MCCVLRLCAKFAVCIITLAVIASGVALVALSFYYRAFEQEMGVLPMSAAYTTVLIVVGCAVTAVGVVGCVASYLSIELLMRVYAGALVVVALMLLVATVYGLTKGMSTMEDKVRGSRKEMQRSLEQYNETKDARERIDNLQKSYRCCGVNRHDDWMGHYQYPESCCKDGKAEGGRCRQTDVFGRGCLDGMSSKFRQHLKLLFTMTAIFAAICVAGAITTIYVTLT